MNSVTHAKASLLKPSKTSHGEPTGGGGAQAHHLSWLAALHRAVSPKAKHKRHRSEAGQALASQPQTHSGSHTTAQDQAGRHSKGQKPTGQISQAASANKAGVTGAKGGPEQKQNGHATSRVATSAQAQSDHQRTAHSRKGQSDIAGTRTARPVADRQGHGKPSEATYAKGVAKNQAVAANTNRVVGRDHATRHNPQPGHSTSVRSSKIHKHNPPQPRVGAEHLKNQDASEQVNQAQPIQAGHNKTDRGTHERLTSTHSLAGAQQQSGSSHNNMTGPANTHSFVAEPQTAMQTGGHAPQLQATTSQGISNGGSANNSLNDASMQAMHAQIRTLHQGGGGQASIQLSPPSLGSVQVQVQMQGNHQAQLTFTAAQQSTAQALQTSLPQLSNALQQNGIHLTHTEVTAGNGHAMTGQQHQGQGGNTPGQHGDSGAWREQHSARASQAGRSEAGDTSALDTGVRAYA